ncbi:MAG: LCP family protein [Mycobacteriales bacterium]
MTAPRLPLPPELDPRRTRRTSSGTHNRTSGGRGRRTARVLSWIATVLSAVVLITAGGLYGLYLHYNGNIKRVGLGANDSVAAANDGSQNYLLVGSDSRNGATPQELAQAHTTLDGGGVNTDVMMLVHLSPHDGKVDFVSLPRDSWVNIPGHGYNKLNAAYAIGGPALLVQEVEQLSGLHIDHFIMVNFFGFIDISNAVGGVRVCLPYPAADSYSGLYLSAGYHTIQGATALAFVRQRHGLPRGDLDRIQRQQEFIGAVIRKAESTGVLLNPFRLNDLLNAVTQSLTVDAGLTLDDMRTLALRLRHLDTAHVNFLTVPIANPNGYVNGLSVVELDYPEMAALFANIRANRPPYYLPPAAGTQSVPVGSPTSASPSALAAPLPATSYAAPVTTAAKDPCAV